LCALGALLVVIGAVGCAGNESYPNHPKPPAILTVSIFVGEDTIALSPNPFGAGPTRFIVTNQTGTKQKVLISTDQFDREELVGVGQTVNFKQTVEPGELSVSADNTAADSLTIDVGPTRESAQHDLNQP
jgi:hypothetical protein